MIRRLFRWIHWRARSRYWRHRALKTEALLEAETLRNREREDELVTVPMRIAGLFAPPPRTGPILKPINRMAPTPVTPLSDPWNALSWADKNEFDMFWKADAAAAGVPEHEARQKFLLEIESRRTPLNDDPYGAN